MEITTDPTPRPLPALPAGVDRLPRGVIVSHQRDRVLVSAIEVFASRGYRATTIDHLVGASHTGVGSFYALFDGKEDCFLRAYNRIIEAASARIAAAIPAAAPWRERTRAALEALLNWIAAEPAEARIGLVEAQRAGPAALARYETTLERLASLLRDGRTRSSTGRELPLSHEHATVAGVAWLLNERLQEGEPSGIGALLPDLLEIVIAPYFEGETQTTQGAPGFAPERGAASAAAGAILVGSAP